jgi:hypothetical protein
VKSSKQGSPPLPKKTIYDAIASQNKVMPSNVKIKALGMHP